jgi:alpha-amylase
MSYSLCLFDVPLVYNLARVSQTRGADLRSILPNTLVTSDPAYAVTCVGNHDTQLGQVMAPAATVAQPFLASAYAFTLLRAQGVPCLFYGHLYGIQEPHARPPMEKLPLLCRLRRYYAHGRQRDYFDQPHCVGWTREGTEGISNGNGLAVVVANYLPARRRSWRLFTSSGASTVTKHMCVGACHAGETWKNVHGGIDSKVYIHDNGFGAFLCPRHGLAIWANEKAKNMEELEHLYSPSTFERSLLTKASDADIYHRV